jgi:hypothetical protein
MCSRVASHPRTKPLPAAPVPDSTRALQAWHVDAKPGSMGHYNTREELIIFLERKLASMEQQKRTGPPAPEQMGDRVGVGIGGLTWAQKLFSLPLPGSQDETLKPGAVGCVQLPSFAADPAE